MDTPIRFKKYANRRLYNITDSRYMNLNEIEEIIRQGAEIVVTEAKTKEDVTAFILTQIILEQAKNKNTLLPVPLLHLLIRYGDNVLIDFFDNYLQRVIGSYLEYKQAMDIQFQRWLDLSKNLAETAQHGMNPVNPFQAFFTDRDKDKNRNDDK
ncbi:MAG: transcriptional regulator [Desulfofustis sp.]|nr:transcriptional regulator [Desulfofustis sp.]NNK12820.1 transcriptional regulator [Desulfofustis sp.]NNK56502.1 transcriptional regulator [Desulfofustis sp.]